MFCGIYKITNKINKKAYIGASIDIQRRWKEHKRMLYKADIYDAFKKYGIDNFTFEVVELCQQEELNLKEKYWINFYNTYKNGYNMTTGGEGGFQKIGKKVVQYDLNGNFISIYESITYAERCLNIPCKSSNITRVCQGKAYESNGYQWRYLNENIDYTQNIGKSPLKEKLKEGSKKGKLNRVYESKKVAQCDKDSHKIIKIFNSIKEASEETNTCFTSIYKVCNGKRKTAGGYYWINIIK